MAEETDILTRAAARLAAGQPIEPGLARELDAVFAGYRPRLVRLCAGWVGDSARGEELAQDAIATAWSKLDTFRFESSFFHFLAQIARNHGRNARRKLHEQLSEDGVIEAASEDHDALAELREDERERVFFAAIADLPELEQEVLYLRYVEGLDRTSITERLELTGASGARGALQSATRHLRTRLRAALVSLGHGSSFFRAS